MTRPEQPPKTYQQWLDCFGYLAEHPGDVRAVELVRDGSYPGKPSDAFLVRLSDTVGVLLSFFCQRFLRQLDQALEDSEPDLAPLLASRLRRDLHRCLFYRELPFLDGAYVQELDGGYTLQLQNFWRSFLTQLRRTARDSSDPRMEELMMELSRIKII